MTVRFVNEAQLEYLDAIDFYEKAGAGLGRRFKEQVDRGISLIATGRKCSGFARVIFAG